MGKPTSLSSKAHSLHQVYSWCYACWDLNKHVLTCMHPYTVIPSGFTALWILCTPPVQPSVPEGPDKHWWWLCMSAFCRMSDGWSHTPAFSHWLPSLSDMHLRFPCVFSWHDSFFYPPLDNSHYLDVLWSIYSAAESLGCFQVLMIKNKAAIKICVQFFVQL
jgi:hypothetical protein